MPRYWLGRDPGSDYEGKAVAAELWVLRDDGEDEGGGEGKGFAVGGVFESDWGGVEGMAEDFESVVCEL